MKVTSIRSLCAVVCGMLVVIGWTVTEAQTQQRGRGMGRGMMGRGMSVTRLLGLEQVQKEINMTEEQKTNIEKMRGESRQRGRNRGDMRNQWEELQKLSQEDRRKRMESMRNEYRERAAKRTKETMQKLANILDTEQLMRVKQIQMQIEGVAALHRPEVMKHIGLDDEQKEQIKKISEEGRDQMRQLMRSGRDQDGDGAQRNQNRQQRREKIQKAREEIKTKAMAVLKPEQKKRLAEMMGKPFKLDRSAFGRRGGGRRGEG